MRSGRSPGLLAGLLLGWVAAAPGLAEDPEEEALRQFVESIDRVTSYIVMLNFHFE